MHQPPIGRSVEHSILSQILPFSNCIFVSGAKSYGKSMLLKSLLWSHEEYTVFVNVTECLSEHMLFQRIINKWSNSIPNVKSDFKGYSACKGKYIQ
jgi:predicted AAA+ superfamily ATPase